MSQRSNVHFHILHYMILVFILAIAVITFTFFTGYPDRQFDVSILTCSAYFIWGFLHHRAEGDLHPKIVVEYLVISLLALFLLRGAIYR